MEHAGVRDCDNAILMHQKVMRITWSHMAFRFGDSYCGGFLSRAVVPGEIMDDSTRKAALWASQRLSREEKSYEPWAFLSSYIEILSHAEYRDLNSRLRGRAYTR